MKRGDEGGRWVGNGAWRRGSVWQLVLILGLGGCAAAAAGEPVAWGERIAPGPGAWTRLWRENEHCWLSVRTEHREGWPTRLVVARSGDRCRSWADVGSIEQPGRNLDNGLLFRGEGGPLLMACRSVAQDRSSGRLLVFRCEEGSGGSAWQLLSTIDASEVPAGQIFGRGLWEPWLYVLPDGRLAAAYASEKRSRDREPYSQICAVRASADGGASWGEERVVAAERGGGKLRPGMPVVIRLRSGRYLAVYEVVGIGDAQVFLKESGDGLEWPEGLGRAVPGHRAAPYVLELETGRLLLTSCANRISWSDDGGASWTMAVERGWEPDQDPSRTWLTWPALYDLGDGEVLLSSSSIRRRASELRIGKLQP